MGKRTKGMLVWVWLSVLILALDQISKIWVQAVLSPYEEVIVLPFFSWILVYNTGAAFSFLSDAGGWQQWFFIILTFGISLYLLYELHRLESGNIRWALTYALILGGAWGNLWDRLAQGKVTDFILLHYQQYNFPVFNLADSAISLGVAVWIFIVFMEWREQDST